MILRDSATEGMLSLCWSLLLTAITRQMCSEGHLVWVLFGSPRQTLCGQRSLACPHIIPPFLRSEEAQDGLDEDHISGLFGSQVGPQSPLWLWEEVMQATSTSGLGKGLNPVTVLSLFLLAGLRHVDEARAVFQTSGSQPWMEGRGATSQKELGFVLLWDCCVSQDSRAGTTA